LKGCSFYGTIHTKNLLIVLLGLCIEIEEGF